MPRTQHLASPKPSKYESIFIIFTDETPLPYPQTTLGMNKLERDASRRETYNRFLKKLSILVFSFVVVVVVHATKT